MLVRPIEHLKRVSVLHGVHRGVVVDNEGGLGRIRVALPGVYPDVDENPDLIESLPWVYPKVPVGQGGSSFGSGLEVPEIGAEVNVEFMHDDPHFPFYTHKWDSEATHGGRFDEDYPDSYGRQDPAGNLFKVNKTRGSIEIVLASGIKITTDSAGNATVALPGKLTFQNLDGSVSTSLDPDTGELSTDSHGPQIITSDLQIESRQVTAEVDTWNEDITGNKTVQTGGPLEEKIGGSHSSSVVGNDDEVIGQGHSTIVGGRRSVTVGAGYDITLVTGILSILALAGDITIGNLLSLLTISAGGTMSLTGTLVSLGLGIEPMLLGQSTVQWLQTHTHPTGVGPSGPPNEAAQAIQLISKTCFLS